MHTGMCLFLFCCFSLYQSVLFKCTQFTISCCVTLNIDRYWYTQDLFPILFMLYWICKLSANHCLCFKSSEAKEVKIHIICVKMLDLFHGNTVAWYVWLKTSVHWGMLTWISAGRYTGSYRIPVFIFLMIWTFKIPQYRCHLNNVRNTTPFERGLFSLLHCVEGTAVCVTERESSETEAVELVGRELSHKYHTHKHDFSTNI